MTWNVTYVQDTDTPGVGTASATFTDIGSPSVVVSRRLDTNNAQDISKYRAECVSVLATAVKLSGDSAAVINKVGAALNGLG